MNVRCQALLFDLSGVLYEGDRVIAGAAELVAQARERQRVLRFVTNTVSKSHDAILSQLQGMGIALQADELYTAPAAARAYIEAHGLHPYCIIPPSIVDEFDSVEPERADAVVIADVGDGFNYRALNRAFRLCMEGAPLIAIGMNKYYRDGSGLNLDVGAFAHGLEWAADVRALVMGKPGRDFFRQVVASTGVPAEQCLMVGDDVISDVQGAREAGLQGALVKTGKYRPADLELLPRGALLLESVTDLAAYL